MDKNASSTPGWEEEISYKLVDLYVKELIERREKRVLSIEGLVEAYLYVLGRLKASKHEINAIVEEIKKERSEKGKAGEEVKEAIGKKNVSAGLLKALEEL